MSRLQATMDALSRKRQKDFEQHSKWNNQIQYYKNWDRHNNQYQNWTSSQYYATSLDQYKDLKASEKKSERLEERREKLRKLFFQEEQDFQLELSQSPRNQTQTRPNSRAVSTETLTNVNLGLKLAEDDRKRHEAELNLYHQWKNENPIVRDYEVNQHKAGLKLAWLDQQIEKRMEQEKTEEETKQMIKERDRLIKEDEELERFEQEQFSKKEQDIMTQIELQMKQFRLKDQEAALLHSREAQVLKQRAQFEMLLNQRHDDLTKTKQHELQFYNLTQSKLKLRARALNVEEQLRQEQKLIEELIASQVTEAIENETKRTELKSGIKSFLDLVRDQLRLEDQRRKYLSFCFDSEAKMMWEKQEKVWKDEQNARDQLLRDVLTSIRNQIDDKVARNVERQRELLRERESMLKLIEESNLEVRLNKDDLSRRKLERSVELDRQIWEKGVAERERKLEEEKVRERELEAIRKEEERLKQELMKMQTRQYPECRRRNRRIIW